MSSNPRTRGASPFPLAGGIALTGLLLLAGCGDLPQPFMGWPGANAMRLAQPPPGPHGDPDAIRLAAGGRGRAAWAQSLADDAAGGRNCPSCAGAPMAGDWRLVLSAKTQGQTVIPTYTVIDPKGGTEGSVDGPPVPSAAWAAGAADTVKAAADAEAPKVLSLLSSIEAHRQQSDPNSLLNRPPRIFLAGVTGAPGDGNAALTVQMNTRLPHLGDVMADSPAKADFTVRGEIKTAPGAGNTTRVEVQWIVVDSRAARAGGWCRSTRCRRVRSIIIGARWPKSSRPRRPAACMR